jgi:hypothetical protein
MDFFLFPIQSLKLLASVAFFTKSKSEIAFGSAWGPVILPVFKTGGRRVTPSPVRSTRTRFRQLFMSDRSLSQT